MPKGSNYWGKNRRSGNNNSNNNNNNNGSNNGHGEKGGSRGEHSHPNSSSNNNNNSNNHNGRDNHGSQGGANKRPAPTIRSRSELRRILHDKLEWNEKTTTLDLTLLVCADESEPAEAELIVVSSGCVASTTRYVRSDIVEAQRRREKEERERLSEYPESDEIVTAEPGKSGSICDGDELFRFDPCSKTHKCKVLNQIARAVQKAWCGLLFVPAYQLGQATAFIRALNPKPDSVTHYVDGYISRLCCLEDLLWALRSARGLLNVEPPLAYSIWHSMREEDMAQLSEYTELTCTCVIATLHERAQAPPPSLLAGSELWPSVVVPARNCQPTRLPWPSQPADNESTSIDEIFNDDC